MRCDRRAVPSKPSGSTVDRFGLRKNLPPETWMWALFFGDGGSIESPQPRGEFVSGDGKGEAIGENCSSSLAFHGHVLHRRMRTSPSHHVCVKGTRSRNRSAVMQPGRLPTLESRLGEFLDLKAFRVWRRSCSHVSANCVSDLDAYLEGTAIAF